MELIKINKQIVKPIPGTDTTNDKIKGYDLFPELYANIFLCAKKKSGKTSVIFKIIQKCIDSDTRLFVFCPTHLKDENWVKIKEWLKENNINALFFDSITDHGVNMVDTIMDVERKEAEAEAIEKQIEEEKKKIPEEAYVSWFDESDSGIHIKIKKKKKAKEAPKIMFVFDDISTELKDPCVSALLKINRHFKSKVIISSQYPNDLQPGSRKQIDFWLIFRGHQREKLEEIYKNADINIPFEEFANIYDQVTKEDYSFLYIDTRNNELRKNFNYDIRIK